jgi:hypothetical protein
MSKWVPRVEYDEHMASMEKQQKRHLARIEAAKNAPVKCDPVKAAEKGEECPEEAGQQKEDWSSWARNIKL